MKTKSINWIAGSGQSIEIILTAGFELNSQGRRKNSGRMELKTIVKVDGKSLGLGVRLEMINHPQAVAKLGNGTKAVAMTKENFDRYSAAKNELLAIVENNNAAIDSHAAELDAITEETKAIENKMVY